MRQEGTGKIETYSQKKKLQLIGNPEWVARTPVQKESTKGPECKEMEKEREKRNSSGTKTKQQKLKKENYGKD